MRLCVSALTAAQIAKLMSKKNNQKLRVNTATLRDYANNLTMLNSRVADLSSALEAVCAASGTDELRQQLRPEVLKSGKTTVDSCIRYLRDTASDFEALERELSRKI